MNAGIDQHAPARNIGSDPHHAATPLVVVATEAATVDAGQALEAVIDLDTFTPLNANGFSAAGIGFSDAAVHINDDGTETLPANAIALLLANDGSVLLWHGALGIDTPPAAPAGPSLPHTQRWLRLTLVSAGVWKAEASTDGESWTTIADPIDYELTPAAVCGAVCDWPAPDHSFVIDAAIAGSTLA